MKPGFWVACVAVAAITGAGASALFQFANPAAAPVHAQQAQFRVAVINLEAASKASATYKERKIKFDEHLKNVRERAEKAGADYNNKRQELSRLRAANAGEEQVTNLEIELKVLEEAQRVTDERQRQWLADLRDKYQWDVLQVVLAEAEKICARNGYHLLLQDVPDETSLNDDVFTARARSQAVMMRSVLWPRKAAGVSSGRLNDFITDITSLVEDAVKDK